MSLVIDEYKINNIHESILASGLPMSKELGFDPHSPYIGLNDMHRAKKLGKVRVGTGHDCYLKGINVFLVITAPEYWWKQFDRYSFQDTVSSTSTMHKVLEFDLNEVLPENIYPGTIEALNSDLDAYKFWIGEAKSAEDKDVIENSMKKAKNIWKRIICNMPMGMKYTRAITTNFLQLKTIYHQRKNHKLDEWRIFCSEVEALPLFKRLVLDE